MKYRNFILILLASLYLISGSSCEKLVDVGPSKNALDPAVVYSDSANVEATLAGMYSLMYNASSSNSPYGGGISYLNALYADELTSASLPAYENNALNTTDASAAAIWAESYAAIYRANSIIEGVTSSTTISAGVRDRAIAESKFIRAFCHFNLLNTFGHIPIVKTTDAVISSRQSQVSDTDAYQAILSDLQDAVPALSVKYPADRVRANKYAVMALLAKVYLYMGNWEGAETQSGLLIADTQTFKLIEPAKVFLTASTEAIWQFDSRVKGYATIATVLVPLAGAQPRYIIRDNLLKSFETGDLRKDNWIATSAGYAYPAKYKSTSGNKEYDVVLRLAEQYLIHAEACARQGKVQAAQDDINAIRKRANLTKITTLDQDLLLQATAKERQLELFCEWGNRFYDLKRTGKIDAVLGALKPGIWKSDAALYPIPAIETGKNTNLVQNPGYN